MDSLLIKYVLIWGLGLWIGTSSRGHQRKQLLSFLILIILQHKQQSVIMVRHQWLGRYFKIYIVFYSIYVGIPQISACFHRHPCEHSNTLPLPYQYAWCAPHCCPGGSACHLTYTEVSLTKQRGQLVWNIFLPLLKISLFMFVMMT